jgi:hypothetical protein
MLDKEENVGTIDNLRLYIAQHKPGTSKHALTDATYEIKDLSPFAVDFSGAPLYKKTTTVIGLVLFYLIYWFWYGWVNVGFINYQLLEKMTWGAFFGAVGVIIVLIAMLIDYHKGSFAKYKRIIEMRVRFLDRRPLVRAEFKIKDSIELYNPVTGGYWRDEKYKKEIAEAEALLEAETGFAKIETILRTDEDAAKLLDAKEAEMTALKEKMAALEEKFEPVDRKADDLSFYDLEGKRFHSIRDMKKIMDAALGAGEVTKTKDEVKRVLELKRRFVDLAEKIRLPFVATLCVADTKGGRIYPLFLSQHSLFGGSTGLGSFVEFKEHTLAQRTWAGIVSKDNVRAGVGEGIEIGMYKFYELVPDDFTLLGKKEEKMKFAPIIYVTASDAQAEKIMDDFRYNETRDNLVQQDLIDASVIYDSSVADGLFEIVKLIVARLKRKEKSTEELENDMEYEKKETINRGLEKSLIVERAGRSGIFRNINLFSHKSIRYLCYIVGIIGTVFLLLYILHFYGGINLGWAFGDLPGNETVTDDPWGNIISPLWEWVKNV